MIINVKIPSSFLQRLVTINTIIIVIALTLISGLIYAKEYFSSVDRQINSLSSLAIIITERLTGVMAFEDYDLARKNISGLKLNEDILTACLYDSNRQLVTKFNRNSNDREFCTQTSNVSTSLMVDRPISLDGQTLGRLVLYADPKLFWRNLITMSVFLLFIGTLCFFLTWLLSNRYFKKETQSLLTLAATAREISTTGDYKLRVNKGDNPAKEISNLVTSFNDLLEIVENHSGHLEEMISIRTSQLNKEKKKVENISEAKSEFLAKLSHDIRTPLTSILGYTELINNNQVVQEKHRNHIDAIIRNAEFVSELVNGLLSLAKLESTDLISKNEPFDINKILAILKQTFQPLAESKNLMLELNTTQLKENWLKGDSLKLHQVLNNLLENAVKYTQEGNIKLTITQTSVAENKVKVSIKIKDSGIGISNKKINEIFDDYMQIGSNTTQTTGAGLGLAIAKRLIDSMNGKISVHSNISQGSTFSIEIPFDVAASQNTNHANANDDLSSIKKFLLQQSPILTIDDDPDCREIVSELILSQQPQATIIQASSFKQAIELFSAHQPKLVFTDIELPDGNGYELSKELRLINKNTVIVAISAYYTSDEYRSTNDISFNHFIAKPFHKQNLIDTLSLLIKRRHQK